MVKSFQAARSVNSLYLPEKSTPIGIRAHLPHVVLDLEWIPCPAWRLYYNFILFFFCKESMSPAGKDYP